MLYHLLQKMIVQGCQIEFSKYGPLLQQRIASNNNNLGGKVESVDSNGYLSIRMTDGTLQTGINPGSAPVGANSQGFVIGGKFVN